MRSAGGTLDGEAMLNRSSTGFRFTLPSASSPKELGRSSGAWLLAGLSTAWCGLLLVASFGMATYPGWSQTAEAPVVPMPEWVVPVSIGLVVGGGVLVVLVVGLAPPANAGAKSRFSSGVPWSTVAAIVPGILVPLGVIVASPGAPYRLAPLVLVLIVVLAAAFGFGRR